MRLTRGRDRGNKVERTKKRSPSEKRSRAAVNSVNPPSGTRNPLFGSRWYFLVASLSALALKQAFHPLVQTHRYYFREISRRGAYYTCRCIGLLPLSLNQTIHLCKNGADTSVRPLLFLKEQHANARVPCITITSPSFKYDEISIHVTRRK